MQTPSSNFSRAVIICLVIVLAAAAYYTWREHSNKVLKNEELEQTKKVLLELKIEKEGLVQLTEDQEESLTFLARELEKITGTVNILEKLQNTDEELLQKYSKVYFLNEHYVPASLRAIPEEFIDSKDATEMIHSKVLEHLVDMMDAAEKDEVHLRVVSAYRSFDEQSELKAGYSVVYGSGANTFSADQGYSEHQLGTTADFSLKDRARALDGFESTIGYEWLNKNAYKYGFILSYPEGNSYYVFEPWHWRFVGVKLAMDLNNSSESFYDLDQRKIDEYLVDLFD